MQPEPTLESLAARVAELERKQALRDGIMPASRDFAEVVGMFEESEFSRQVDAEIQATRDAERRALDEGREAA